VARVTGIGGAFFKARDPEALAAWYRERLGVPVEDGNFAVFRWGGAGGAAGSTTWAVFRDDTDYFGPSHGGFMLNFRVGDLDRVLGELRQEGVEVLDKVEEHEYGRFGWIVDPEGNRVELWQPPEGQ
jgi:predicted enzyme related to lactoylglutathione lyase